MSLLAKVGRFYADKTKNIGETQIITGVGFQPKAVLFIWGGATGTNNLATSGNYDFGIGFGVTSGTNQGYSSFTAIDASAKSGNASHSSTGTLCLASYSTAVTLVGSFNFHSLNEDGFTLGIKSKFTASSEFSYLALGGDDFEQAKIGWIDNITSTGTYSVTDIGFQPSAILFFHVGTTNVKGFKFGMATSPSNQGVVGTYASYNTVTMDTAGYSYSGENFYYATDSSTISLRSSFVSFLSNGFSINILENSAFNGNICYIAFKGGQYSVGNLLTRTDGNDISESIGFQPVALLFASANRAEDTQDIQTNHSSLSIGLATSTTEREAIATWDEDALADSEVAHGSYNNAIYANIKDDANQGLMDLKSINADGFTAVMDDTDPTACWVTYLAIGSNAPAGAITGTASITLSNIEFSSIITNSENVRFSNTLDDLTLSSDGTVQNPLIYSTGTLNIILDNLTNASQSTLSIYSNTNKVLDDVLFSSNGTEANFINLSKTLDNITQSILGNVATNVNLSKILDDLSSTLNSTTDNFAQFDKTLDDISFSSVGIISISSNLSKTLDDLIASSIGSISTIVSSINTLEDVSSSFAGTVATDCELIVTLEDATLVSEGTIGTPSSSAELNVQLDEVSAILSGIVDVKTNSDITLENSILISDGSAGILASLVSSLESISTSSLGNIETKVNSSIILDDLSSSLLGDISSNAILNTTLEILTLNSAGTVETPVDTNNADLNSTLDDLVSLASSTVQIFSTLDKTLDDIVFTTNGKTSIFGTFDKTLDDATLSGIATITTTTNATLSVTLDDIIFSSNGTVVTIVLPTYTWSDRVMKVQYQNRTYTVPNTSRNQLEQNRTYKVKRDKQKVIEYDNVYEVED